jgi:hypothetical protein
MAPSPFLTHFIEPSQLVLGKTFKPFKISWEMEQYELPECKNGSIFWENIIIPSAHVKSPP